MGVPRTVGVVAAPATAGWRTPVVSGTVTAAVTFSITNNIATIVLGAGNLPLDGYNGPNGYPATNATTGSVLDIHGGNAGSSPQGSGGQQVTLWGFTTATYFNGVTATILDCNPTNGSFRFYFTHANVGSTSDAGNTAPALKRQFRSVRLECSLTNSTNIVYVGDLNVSSTQYIAALSLTGQSAWEIQGENIRGDRIFIFGSSASNCGVQVSTIQ
jgi:hypothetical protein